MAARHARCLKRGVVNEDSFSKRMIRASAQSGITPDPVKANGINLFVDHAFEHVSC